MTTIHPHPHPHPHPHWPSPLPALDHDDDTPPRRHAATNPRHPSVAPPPDRASLRSAHAPAHQDASRPRLPHPTHVSRHAAPLLRHRNARRRARLILMYALPHGALMVILFPDPTKDMCAHCCCCCRCRCRRRRRRHYCSHRPRRPSCPFKTEDTSAGQR